jgi:hypothetical protein
VGNESDPTSVMFVSGIVEALSWDHGAEQN